MLKAIMGRTRENRQNAAKLRNAQKALEERMVDNRHYLPDIDRIVRGDADVFFIKTVYGVVKLVTSSHRFFERLFEVFGIDFDFWSFPLVIDSPAAKINRPPIQGFVQRDTPGNRPDS